MRRDLPLVCVTIVCLTIVYFGLSLLKDKPRTFSSPPHAAPAWLSPRSACIQTVKKPAVYACPDKHVWMDIGPVTPVPGVPRR